MIYRLTILTCALVGAAASTVNADNITTYSDRGSFETAVGVPLTVEDFTDTHHFPITTGVLNSETNLPGIGIFPGTIKAGVTYSTPIGEGNFFNIDAGGGYTGGFLDGFNPSDRELTIKFHNSDPDDGRAVRGFGFDCGSLGSSDFDVLIRFSSGPDQVFNMAYTTQLNFFGFVSDERDITSVIIDNNGGFFGFDLDNFTFDAISEYVLTLSGSCPGRILVEWDGGTPGNQQGLVFGQNLGSTNIPNNQPCSGTVLGVSGQVRLVDPPGIFGNQGGSGAIAGNAGGGACGAYLQLVEGGTCQTSNVAQIP